MSHRQILIGVYVINVADLYPQFCILDSECYLLCSSMAGDSGHKKKHHLKTVEGQLIALSHMFK